LYTEQGEPTGLGLAGASLYWVNRAPAALYRGTVEGGARGRVDDVVDNIQGPWDIAADDAFVYWTEYEANTVWRKPRSGGAKERVAFGAGRVAYFTLGPGQLYATDYRLDTPATGSVTVAALAPQSPSAVVYAQQPLATGIALDRNILVWGRGGDAGALYTAPEADGGGGAVAQLVLDVGEAVHGVAAAGDDIYYVAGERRLVHLRRSDPRPEILYEAVAPFGAGDVAVDDRAVYWTEPRRGLVQRLAR
jgi:hypothetical protein